jgi:hypothetical protein
MRHEPIPLARAWNTALVTLETWSTTSTSGKPSPDRRHMSRMIAEYRVRYGLPPSPLPAWGRHASGPGPCRRAGRRGSGSCRTLPPSSGARRSSPLRSSHPAGMAAAGVGEAPEAAMLRPSSLARLARPHKLGNLHVLAHPKGEASDLRSESCFGMAKVSPRLPGPPSGLSWHSRCH